MTKCKSADKYLALAAPKCRPVCQTCADKWATELRDRHNAVLIDAALTEVRAEMVRAFAKHGAMRTWHEAYGVITEEFNKEFLDAMHANDAAQCRAELIQVAAMATRAIVDLTRP